MAGRFFPVAYCLCSASSCVGFGPCALLTIGQRRPSNSVRFPICDPYNLSNPLIQRYVVQREFKKELFTGFNFFTFIFNCVKNLYKVNYQNRGRTRVHCLRGIDLTLIHRAINHNSHLIWIVWSLQTG